MLQTNKQHRKKNGKVKAIKSIFWVFHYWILNLSFGGDPCRMFMNNWFLLGYVHSIYTTDQDPKRQICTPSAFSWFFLPSAATPARLLRWTGGYYTGCPQRWPLPLLDSSYFKSNFQNPLLLTLTKLSGIQQLKLYYL